MVIIHQKGNARHPNRQRVQNHPARGQPEKGNQGGDRRRGLRGQQSSH